jgi:hypothetical protein
MRDVNLRARSGDAEADPGADEGGRAHQRRSQEPFAGQSLS